MEILNPDKEKIFLNIENNLPEENKFLKKM